MFLGLILSLSILPEQASNWALEIDYIFWLVTGICGISFILVEGALLYLVIKYRRRKNEEDRVTPFITHNTRLEIIWTIIPAIVMLVVFYYGAITYYEMRKIPSDYRQIDIVGRQWSWKFTYANGVNGTTQSVCSGPQYKNQLDCENRGHSWRVGDTLIVPLNQQVVLRMNSKDVIHSFYIPAFRIKQDVVPGVTAKLWFTANKPGVYDIFCAEYCGLDHSGMLGKIEVKSTEDFDTWLVAAKEEQEKFSVLGQTPEQLAKLGKELFLVKKGCVACHRLDGQRLVGPPLNGIFGKNEYLTDGTKVKIDENYLYKSIMDPMSQVVKADPPYPPMNAQDVNENEVKAIIEYLKACKGVNCGGT